MYLKHNSGFTLIEILVVAAILSLIASFISSAVNQARPEARDSQRLTDLNSLRTSMQLFRDERGRFPNSYNELKGEGVLINAPKDPSMDKLYPYATSSGGNFDLCLAACMELPSNAGGANVCNDSSISYTPNESYIKNDCDPANEYYLSL